MTRRLLVLAALALAGGCINIDLPSPTIVDTPRILAIVSEPPEAAPGEDVSFAALLVNRDGSPLVDGVNGVEIEWTVCVGLGSLLDASGFFTAPGDEACVDVTGQPTDPLVLEGADGLPEGVVQLDGDVTQELGDQLELLRDLGQDPELSALIEGVLLVGVPLEAEIRVTVPQPDGELFVMRGFKRVGLTTREDRTTNPPPPRFRVGELWYTGRDLDTPFRCEPEGEAAGVEASEAIDIRPDEDDDFWIESYPVFNLNGDIQINDESSFYSFFSTAGGSTKRSPSARSGTRAGGPRTSRRWSRTGSWCGTGISGARPAASTCWWSRRDARSHALGRAAEGHRQRRLSASASSAAEVTRAAARRGRRRTAAGRHAVDHVAGPRGEEAPQKPVPGRLQVAGARPGLGARERRDGHRGHGEHGDGEDTAETNEGREYILHGPPNVERIRAERPVRRAQSIRATRRAANPSSAR